VSDTKSLKDFVENYVKNKQKSDGKESYERWLRRNGIDSYGIYSDAIRDISTDYKRSVATYGSVAEKLGELGLSSAGYSDYIGAKAYSEMQRSKEEARGALAKNEAKNRTGYAEYLESKEKEAKSDYTETVKEITDANIMNYDEAYAYAVSKGLSTEAAALAAKAGGDAVHKKMRAAVLSVIVNQNYNRKQAAEYATALGLGEEEAAELAKYADVINASGYYTKDYLEYLEEKLKESESEK